MKKAVCLSFIIIMVFASLGMSISAEVGPTIAPTITPIIPVITKPKAPSLLEVSNAPDSAVSLSWKDNANNETGFIIERKSAGDGSYSRIAMVVANTVSYTDTELPSATNIFYRVKAYNKAGESAYSNDAAYIILTTQTPTPTPSTPPAPTTTPMSASASASLPSTVSVGIASLPDMSIVKLSADIKLQASNAKKVLLSPVDMNAMQSMVQKDVTILYPTGGEKIRANQVLIMSFNVKKAGTYLINLKADVGDTTITTLNAEENSEYMAYFNYSGETVIHVKLQVIRVSNNNQDIVDESGEFTIGEAPLLKDTCLKATPGNNSVKLSWDPIASAPGKVAYNICRGTALADVHPITDFAVEENFYTDNNVKNGTTYYYRIKGKLKGLETVLPLYQPVSVIPNGTIVLTVGNPNMTVNGETKEIDPGKGTAPIIVNGRTFVPIRAMIESMGGTVGWDGVNKVTIELNQNRIELKVGIASALVNGTQKALEVAPYISETGRTMLPLRFIIENLEGCDVDWEWTTKTVTIKY